MSDSAPLTPEVEPQGISSVDWIYDPWRERPRTALAASATGLGLCAVILLAHQPWVLSVALAIAAVGMLSPALTRLECRVDAEGVARRGPLGWERRRWRDLRRARIGASGLFVSPFAEPHALDPYRGLLLPWARATTARLTAGVRAHLDRHGL